MSRTYLASSGAEYGAIRVRAALRSPVRWSPPFAGCVLVTLPRTRPVGIWHFWHGVSCRWHGGQLRSGPKGRSSHCPKMRKCEDG